MEKFVEIIVETMDIAAEYTFANLRLAKGHPIIYVSAQFGHSDPSTTLRWYAHRLPTSDKRFADALDAAHCA